MEIPPTAQGWMAGSAVVVHRLAGNELGRHHELASAMISIGNPISTGVAD